VTEPAGLYAMPVLGRFGLAHGLLAWARCRLWCEEHGARMLAPNWFTLRLGPYLRGERDKRNYWLLFHAGRAVAGPRRLMLLARARAIDVGPEWPSAPEPEARPVLLRFHNALVANEVKSFDQVRGRGAWLRQELLAITRRRFHPAVARAPHLAIHVRLGDFSRPPADTPEGATNTRLPMDWYVDRLQAVRQVIGREAPAVVFSDGEDAELAALLALPGVVRAPRQASVTDLLQMGQAACVISSGSGFSLWGAFLGDAARLCHPGQLIVPALGDAAREVESGFGEPLPESFAEPLRGAFR
jgi:hypothetical protein